MIHKISKFKIKTALVLLTFSFASGSNMAQLGIPCVSFNLLFASSVKMGSESTVEQAEMSSI